MVAYVRSEVGQHQINDHWKWKSLRELLFASIMILTTHFNFYFYYNDSREKFLWHLLPFLIIYIHIFSLVNCAKTGKQKLSDTHTHTVKIKSKKKTRCHMIDVISISNNVISIRSEWVCLYSLTCNVCTCVCVGVFECVANYSHSFRCAEGNKTVCAQHIKLADKCNWSNGITEHVTKRKCCFFSLYWEWMRVCECKEKKWKEKK